MLSGKTNVAGVKKKFLKITLDKSHFITGDTISLNDGVNTNKILQVFDDDDNYNYGAELSIGAGGNLFIGSGESAYYLRTHLINGLATGEAYGRAGENTYISSDGYVFIYSNCNTVGNRIGIVFDTNGNLRPLVNNTRSLGSASFRWASAYIEHIITNMLNPTADNAGTVGTSSYKYDAGFINNLHFRKLVGDYENSSLQLNKTNILNETLQVGNDTSSSNVTGLYRDDPAYPHVIYRQYNSEFQIFPTTKHKGQIGDPGDNQLNIIGAKNIYNSSGIITTSDRNLKKDFELITEEFADDIIDGLIPTSYRYKDGDSGRRHYNLVAQDVEGLLEKLGIDSKDFAPLVKEYPKKQVKFTDENGKEQTRLETDYDAVPSYHLRYEGFTGLIIKYIQNLKSENTKLWEKTEKQQLEICSLKSRMEKLEGQFAGLENIISQGA